MMTAFGVSEIIVALVIFFLLVLSFGLFIAPLMIWHRLTQLNEKTEETNTRLKYIQKILRTAPENKCPSCGGLVLNGEKKCPLCDIEFE